MNILIYGSKSFIAQEFIEFLENNKIKYCFSKIKKIDINSRQNIIDEIDILKPTNCISFIGRTHGKINDKVINSIDYLDEEGKDFENFRDNFFVPQLLSEVCNLKNLHLIYIGTGCIFNYVEPFEITKDNINDVYKFKEEDNPNYFGSTYSILKGYVDQNLRKYDNVLNLRIRMPVTYKKNQRNLITKLLNYDNIYSIYNSISVLPELFPYIIKLMEMKYVGILNFTNPGGICHNDILEIYNKFSSNKKTWNNLNKTNTILSVKRCNNILDTNKLETLFPEIKNIYESIEDIIKIYVKQ